MKEARKHPRIPCRLPLDLMCGEEPGRLSCHTHDIGIGGLFAEGAQCMRANDSVRIELGPSRGERLHLNGRVARVDPTGAGLEFVANSPATVEVLQALLSPGWEDGSLLDGVVRIAPVHRDDKSSGWMRLTSIVSDWQHLDRP